MPASAALVLPLLLSGWTVTAPPTEDAQEAWTPPSSDDLFDPEAAPETRSDVEQVEAIELPSDAALSAEPPLAPAPSVEPPSPSVRARRGAGAALAITGGVGLGMSAAGLMFLTLPTLVAAEIAEDRADDGGNLLTSEQNLRDRAERRRDFARESAIVCGYIALGGAVLTGVGLAVWPWKEGRMRAKKRRRRAQLGALPLPTRGGGSVSFSGSF